MGKTITTYLIESDPKGPQYVFISNSLCKMYVVPRSNLTILNEREDLHKPAFYILLGEDEDTKPKAYIVTGKQIGRASCRERVCLYV